MRGDYDKTLILSAWLSAVVTVFALAGSLDWLDKPFPGFLLLENRVIGSAGVAGWPATDNGEIYQHEVLSIDGTPLTSADQLRRYVESLPIGSTIHYRLLKGDTEIERAIDTRRFGGRDYTLLFGPVIFCGLCLAGMALAIRYLGRGQRLAKSCMATFLIVGLWALSAADLYGPYRLFRLHVLLECFVFAGTLHTALVFPNPRQFIHRRPRLLALPYIAAACLAVVAQIGLYDPRTYVATHRIAMTAFGASLAVFIASQVWTYLRPPSFEARQRVKVVVIGTVAALLPQLALVTSSVLSGGQTSENVMGWSGILIPLALGYAVLRDDLLEVDVLLRQSLNYALLTGLVALLYVAAFAGFDSAMRDNSPGSRGAFAVVLGAVSVVILLPLRDYMQSGINRLFFRSSYDFRRLVETTSAHLASLATLEELSTAIRSAVRDALQPRWIALELRRIDDSQELSSTEQDLHIPQIPEELLQAVKSQSSPVALPDGALAVPFRVEHRLVALLHLGPRLSGRFYTGDDRRLLQTLANQGAVAIENSLVLEQMGILNRNLERKVDERTSKLTRAVEDLQEAQAQLVQREKMASVGQLVAGIAHEINNPVNFIQGNLHFIREYADALVGCLGEYQEAVSENRSDLATVMAETRKHYDLDYVIGDLESTLMACEDGVNRTTNIIQGLRTFSRLDDAECSKLKIHEAIDTTLTLLRSRLAGIEVVTEYDHELPQVECLAGQIKQVLMNLLSNAADAMDDGGTLILRTSLAGVDYVSIEVQDSGSGIARSQLDRIFEPFFTTKAVGSGTGLGLAITYGIIARHSGTIRVDSEPGHGAKFSIELPIRFEPTEPQLENNSGSVKTLDGR